MGFVVIFSATWLAVLAFYMMNKSLSFMDNTVVLLMALILGVNLSWLIIEEFQWVQLTKDPPLYTGYLLNRTLLQPLILVLWINYMVLKKTTEAYFFATLACTGLLLGFNSLAEYYQIYRYVQWNVLYDFLSVVLLQGSPLLVYRLASKWMYAEEEPA